MLEVWEEVVSTAPNNAHVRNNMHDNFVVKMFTYQGEALACPTDSKPR